MDGFATHVRAGAGRSGPRRAGPRARRAVLALATGFTCLAWIPADQVARAADPPPPVDTWDTGVDPTTAVLVTPLFPGWGQLYSRSSWRAALAFGTEMYFWSNLIARDQRARRDRDFARNFVEGTVNYDYYNDVAQEDWNQMRDFAWWSGGALLIIALDAYVGAHLFNFDQDPIPVPNRWEDAFDPPGAGLPGASGGPSLTVFQWRKTF